MDSEGKKLQADISAYMEQVCRKKQINEHCSECDRRCPFLLRGEYRHSCALQAVTEGISRWDGLEELKESIRQEPQGPAMEYRAIVIHPGREPESVPVKRDLYTFLHNQVGGFYRAEEVDALPYPFVLVADKNSGAGLAARNDIACRLCGTVWHGESVTGTVVIVRKDSEAGGDGLESLTVQEADSLLRYLKLICERGA